METLEIAYSANDAYAWLLGVSLVSLCENNKDVHLNINILSDKISSENIKKIKSICNKYSAGIKFYDISDFRRETTNIKIDKKWDFATFGRLFEPLVLEKSIKKVIHLDDDTIVNGSLLPLWNEDVSNVAVAGVMECLSKYYNDNIRQDRNRILLNAGVLLFNISYIREHQIDQKFLQCIGKYRHLEYLDQDVLNISLENFEKTILPLKYNVYSILFYCNYKELISIRHPSRFYTNIETEDAVKNPIIVHFTSCFLDSHRPWYKDNKHPFRNKFLSYLSLSPFNAHPLLDSKNSFKHKILNIIPRKMAFSLSYFWNGFLRPKLRKAKYY